MRILTLIDELDKRFEVIINKGAEMVVETEEELDVNLVSIAKLCSSLSSCPFSKSILKI